jgi:hypothetical protein
MQRPPRPGSIKVTDAEWAAIDAELAPQYGRVARALRIKLPPPTGARSRAS